MEEEFDFDAALRSKGVPEEIGGAREAPQGTPSEEVAEEAPEQVEAREEEAPTEAETLLAGKYKSVEDLERAYTEAASKLGQQGTEIGDLRKLIEERLPAEEDEGGSYPEYDPGVAGAINELINAERYQEAAYYAAQSGNGLLYNQALDSWYEEAPRQAAKFERDLEMQQFQAQYQQDRQPDIAARAQSEANTAYQNVARKFPDLASLSDRMQEAGKQYPDVLRVLESNAGVEGKERALEALYKIAKADSIDTLSQASSEAAQVAADEARRDKAESHVASASNAKREAPRTKVDAFKQSIMDAEEISTYSGLERERRD